MSRLGGEEERCKVGGGGVESGAEDEDGPAELLVEDCGAGEGGQGRVREKVGFLVGDCKAVVCVGVL